MAKARVDEAALLQELRDTAQAVGTLVAEPEAFKLTLAGLRAGDPSLVRRGLELVGLAEHCRLICDWFCSKECVLLCLHLAGPPVEGGPVPDPREFADVVAKLTGDEGTLRRLATVVDDRDERGYGELIEEFQLHRFRYLLCHWLCTVRCRLRCRWICEPNQPRLDLFTELQRAGKAVRALAADSRALSRAVRAAQADDCEGLQQAVAGAGLSEHCSFICLWLCSWRCVTVCFVICRRFFSERVDLSDKEIEAFAHATGRLATQPGALPRLAAAVARGDEKRFDELVNQFGLGRFCFQLCHWFCSLRCRWFCFCVCPPLVATIDTPAEGDCAATTLVAGCLTDGAPLIGIEIKGTAAGAGFDHYELRYSWGANPPVVAAVVYPDCGRPPATTGSTTAVVNGTLGYLDAFLLPPGVTAFTVYLDVFDSAAGTASDTATFEVKTNAVEITEVAKVEALMAPDPFHPATNIKLIKAVNDPSVLVPEQSVGGSFSVDGSAYVIGCDRILSQFVLARFAAPPAAPVPTPADATGGALLMPAPVPYEDTPSHPWQSGCLFPTPNTILNGNLVAVWGTVNCPFPFPHTRPKVKGQFWASGPSGRSVILLEARDRALPAGAFPGSVAATDQVAVWIDNEVPTGVITSIGGITGCGDLRLSDFVGAPASIQGQAYDPPCDPSAPQQRPNDNFGSYSLTFKKDGEITALPIPALTPNTRVPNVWPGPPAGDGTLADWDIVSAIDHNGPAPVPPGKLARGTRCAYVISLVVSDTTHVGDSGSNHSTGPFTYAINVINDL